MKSVIVSVFGSDYNVRADSDGDHVKRVAEIVDHKMKEIDGQFHQGSSTRTAVLASMNLVDEHLIQRQEDARWASRQVGLLIDKLESVLGVTSAK
ncbi:MAG TPA: cell division protein ZapA [bacterium]|nr:cell division protein ZapA [bacterium]